MEQGHRGNQHKKHPRTGGRTISLASMFPVPWLLGKKQSGYTQMSTASSIRTSLRSAVTQPYTPAQPCQHTWCRGGWNRITVPVPAHPVRYLLHPSFPREAVKQLQSIMPLAVTGQTVHMKAWFTGTKLLSKLEAFPQPIYSPRWGST